MIYILMLINGLVSIGAAVGINNYCIPATIGLVLLGVLDLIFMTYDGD